MVPFTYSGFYDVPRCIAFEYNGTSFLLQSWFDEEADEYPAFYSAYSVDMPIDDLLKKERWSSPPAETMTYLGKIPISEVVFDKTKRETLDPSVLSTL